MKPYKTWAHIAGYFDGDGSIAISDLSNRPFKLGLSLLFIDQSREQIANVRDFLQRHGIRTSNILKTSLGTANIVVVSESRSLRLVLRRMLPHLYKKANEARAALDYCGGKITGNELLAVFKQEVDAGRRERHPHKVELDVPYTRAEGDQIMKRARRDRLRDAFGRYRGVVTPSDFGNIRRGFFQENKRLRDLVRENPKYSKETIRRILGRDRGYVGVVGLGRVNTTDTTIREPRRAPN